jgi:uncharacterized repeat protein (TIGR01451 family)
VTRLLALLLVMIAASTCFAGSAEAAITFELRTGRSSNNTQTMPIDSNQCASAGPRAMYVGGLVTNTGATTVTDIVASLNGLGNGFFLAGGQPQSQTIGALGAGQSTGVYWFVGYGCVDQATSAPSISITSSTAPATANLSLIARSSLSANAGGNVLSSVLGPGAVVGQTIFFDTSYDFGGSDAGDEIFLQPSGGQNFNAACFRLVGARITGSNIAPITTGTTNRLYFLQTQKQSGNGYFVNVRYSFEYQCAGASSTARPYAMQTSGNSLKYTGNFDGSGAISISFPGATNPFTIAKTIDRASAPGGVRTTVQYTVTVTNPSAHASRISQIVDTLPAGATFVALQAASDVTAANSSSVPAAGASGTLTFTGRQDQSYLIAAGGSVRLIYTVSMPPLQGSYQNSAVAQFGSASTSTASVGFTVTAPPPLTLVKASQAYADPVNGLTNPKMIPGGYAAYTVTVTNPHAFAITADTIALVDATPPRLDLFVGNVPNGSGPILFQNGATPSGLTYTFGGLASTTDDVDFSSDGGSSWSYAPAPNAQGVDPAVTHVRIRPKGSMAAGSSFALSFGYLIE